MCRFTSHFRMIEYFIVSRKTIVVIKALFVIIMRTTICLTKAKI